MNVGSYIFFQVVDYIPRYQFDKLVAKYHGNWHSKDLTCYNQLLHLLFGQITGCGSLRARISSVSSDLCTRRLPYLR